jgi:hypothetical protein
LLVEYQLDSDKGKLKLRNDLESLKAITTEIKSITVQSVLLHGERIHKAQEILKRYRTGIFSKWLTKTYGNRTTPYGMLHYYELYKQLDAPLKEKLKLMPRKAAYKLASRAGDLRAKEAIVNQFKDQKPKELLELILRSFPLDDDDKRKSKKPDFLTQRTNELLEICEFLTKKWQSLKKEHKKKIKRAINLFPDIDD